MNLLVYGAGYVGLTTSISLAEKGNTVVCIDKDKNKIKNLNLGNISIYEKGMTELLGKNLKNGSIKFNFYIENIGKSIDAIFVCVGTPEKSNGDAEVKYVYEVIDDIISKIDKDIIIIIKSTVPIGECDRIEKYIRINLKKEVKIEIVSNPEFLSQGRALKDALEKQRIVIGAESKNSIKVMNKIYKNFEQEKLVTTRVNSEMIKYASNSFLALKISYINEIANLCEKVGANIQQVSKGMGLDERIGNNFLNAGIGYGGSCFPKDTKAFVYLAKKNNYRLKLIEDTIKINEEQNMILIEKAKSILNLFTGLKVAVLGLTFKPNTDDVREAPSIKNIRKLLEYGAYIDAYDPKGIEMCKKIIPNIKYSENIEECINQADLCFIFSEWEEIKKIDTKLFALKMKRPLVFDGRNCYSLEEMKKNKIEYYSIGRKIF